MDDASRWLMKLPWTWVLVVLFGVSSGIGVSPSDVGAATVGPATFAYEDGRYRYDQPKTADQRPQCGDVADPCRKGRNEALPRS